MSTRLGEIKNWLLSLSADIDLDSLRYIQADASDRKYLRANAVDTSYIIMDSKPGKELDNFIEIAQLFDQHKVNVPKIIANARDLGLLLLSDLGDQTYLSVLKLGEQTRRDKLYMDAIVALAKLQKIPNTRPLMDAEYISNRLEVFKTWYLERHLGLEIDEHTDALLARMQKLFTEVFSSQPPVLVHVDYHSRNLMCQDSANPGILDFQDAMLGPASYDLVSLLQDAYFVLPRSELESWVKTFSELGTPVTLRDFDLVGLQRHIKNLGIFARLHHRDQKSHYLNDMPVLMHYISETCARYPELNWLLEFITEAAALALPNQNG